MSEIWLNPIVVFEMFKVTLKLDVKTSRSVFSLGVLLPQPSFPDANPIR